MNTPAAHPPHDMTHNVMNSEESTRLRTSNGEDMPPVPSTCDDDAAGEVINPIPSHTMTPRETSATSTRDMPPVPSTCDNDTAGEVLNPIPTHTATPREASVTSTRDMPPVPSTCDSDAAGEVINPIPSHTATPREASATSARDMSPAPSACDTTGIPTPQDAASKPVKATRMAPNRLVHWNTLKSVVDNHLGPCSTCHLKGMTLEEKGSCSFATNFEIVCGTCDEQTEKKRKEIVYLNKRVRDMKIDGKKEKAQRRALQLKRNHLQTVTTKKFLRARKCRQIKATRMKKVSARERLRTLEKNKGTIMEFEVNVRAMMSSFYGGTGGADIANIASFFGVPGGKSWERAFSRHSPSMCKLITSVVNGVMEASLKNEIIATISDKLEGMTKDEINIATKAYFEQDTDNIPDAIQKLRIAVSYDMGWQKRSTGKIYDSMSGHGFMIGCRTGNIIGFKVKSKTCSVCSKANFLNIPTEEHGCRINYEGSSGGMEAQVALELCTSLHDDSGYSVCVHQIVSDDDSTMRSHLQYEDNSGKGKLPAHIPVPTFLADPSHRVKVMSSPIFKLAQGGTKDPRQCKKIDALRIKKYIGCFIYQNRSLPLSEMIKKAKAPIEHLFNCHEWCDPEWCWAKQLDAKQHELTTMIMEHNNQDSEESGDGDSGGGRDGDGVGGRDGDGDGGGGRDGDGDGDSHSDADGGGGCDAEGDGDGVGGRDGDANGGGGRDGDGDGDADGDGGGGRGGDAYGGGGGIAESDGDGGGGGDGDGDAHGGGGRDGDDNVADEDDDDSDWASICSSESDEEIEVEEGEWAGLDQEEAKECAYFMKYEETHDVDESIFTPADLEEMKNRERVMMERNDRGYYRCKVKDKKLYDEIMGVYSRFITPDMLMQLNHMWSTQKNEAMNTSVSSYAPKNKHYSGTDSLLTRVGIAGACQVIGYAAFWTKVYQAYLADIDPNLLSILSLRDEKKLKSNAHAGTKEGKSKRSRKNHEKINKTQKEYTEGYAAGLQYEAGIALRIAKNSLPKAKDRNPPGTPTHLLKCAYYHETNTHCCNVLGHTACSSQFCDMKKKTKEERKEALSYIEKEKIDAKLKSMASERK